MRIAEANALYISGRGSRNYRTPSSTENVLPLPGWYVPVEEFKTRGHLDKMSEHSPAMDSDDWFR